MPQGAKTFTISSIGMEELIYSIIPGNTEGVRIVLKAEENMLDQVVVTGYAQTTVKRMTGSVAVLSEDTFKSKAISSVDALMQGEAAGVAI